MTTRPSAPPAKLCLDLGIIRNKPRATPQESERPHEHDDPPDSTETPATLRKKGSFYSDRKRGKYPHEWGSLAKFDVWHREELAYSIELIGSTVKPGNTLWLEKRLYVCSRQPSGGQSKYQKKHPKWWCKVDSKKSGCNCRIVIKLYHHTPTILGCYEEEHSHKVGLANLAYTRMSEIARTIKDSVPNGSRDKFIALKDTESQ
ncbi:hypothetical protein BJV78DRAFT_1290317 [Lactifluus subvellereus]|nr:hypothetical protein BJV78DRAFT_1290317 [Lactifluus subvellereus]